MPRLAYGAVLAALSRAEFEEDRALTYAYLSTAAMCSYPATKDNSDLVSWSCGPACDAVPGMSDVFAINSGETNDAFVFGGKLNGECTLVFRGTSDIAGWLEDLKSSKLVDLKGCSYKGKMCQVGDGFLSNYKSLQSHIVGNLTGIGCDASQPLVVTGHSLGAAEAAIAMYDLKAQSYDIVRTYTFGQPRVGDATFAKAFEQDFASAEPWRITHAEDPVPHLPFEFMGFKHMTTEVWYKNEMVDGFKKCDASGEDPSCANSQSSKVAAAGKACASDRYKCAHLNYMTANKTILMNGDNCTNLKLHTIAV